MKKNILITGGTGLVGTFLNQYLSNANYNVSTLTRNKKQLSSNYFFWDYKNKIIDNKALESADIIIHLAGENISAKRWTKKQKQLIEESRIESTNFLYNQIKLNKHKPKMFISASAIGYYGNMATNKVFSEDDDNGSDFLAKVVFDWEKAVKQIETLDIKTYSLRLGIVLAEKGGALEKMLIPIKLGIGSAIGSGKQFVSWISISDLARLILFIIEKQPKNGSYNAVTPNTITNFEFTKTLATTLKKPFFFPKIPAFVLQLIFGEMSSILLTGNKISSNKITSIGFIFNDIDLKQSLLKILKI